MSAGRFGRSWILGGGGGIAAATALYFGLNQKKNSENENDINLRKNNNGNNNDAMAAVKRLFVAEPVTNAKFPIIYDNPALPSEKQVLVGVGLRCMLQKCDYKYARAYAIGFYVPKSPSTVEFFTKMKSETDLLPTETIASTLITDPVVPKTIRLVFSRDVAGKHIATGFDRSLLHRVRKFSGTKQRGMGKTGLKTLTDRLKSEKLIKQGTEMVFTIINGCNLQVHLAGAEIVNVVSDHLCRAVLDAYIGPKPVAAAARDNILKGFSHVINDANTLNWDVSAPPPGTVDAPSDDDQKK